MSLLNIFSNNTDNGISTWHGSTFLCNILTKAVLSQHKIQLQSKHGKQGDGNCAKVSFSNAPSQDNSRTWG